MASHSTTKVSDSVTAQQVSRIESFFEDFGVSSTIPDQYAAHDSYSDIICSSLKAEGIQRGKVSCLLSVSPPLMNFYGGLHGAAVAAVAERVAIGCARTVVTEDRELFLGELSTAYLLAAPPNAELTVDGTVVRSGRNITVVAVDFKLKKSGQLAYTTRATLYNMPVAKL